MTAESIAKALGGRRAGAGWMACCPAHEDRTPSLSLTDTPDDLVLWHCHAGCSQRDIRDALVARGLWLRPGGAGAPVRRAKPKPASKPGSNGHSDFAIAIWKDAVDPRGTLAERYLGGRGLDLDDDLCGRVLRFHGNCPFGKVDNKTIYVPALVVAFRSICNNDETGPPPAIHRIGLTATGEKIAKKMLGSVGGCAVKLDTDEDVELGLGVAEGVETALAIRATGWRPIWALGSACAIRTFGAVPGIEALTIFADHDEKGVGMAAAKTCAQAWQAAGCEVFIRTPHNIGFDWLDVQS